MTILQRLKNETRAQHEELERAVSILDATTTIDDYRAYLARMWGFHAPVERVLADGPPLVDDMHARWKAPLLHKDLVALDLDEDAIRALPQCTALPGLANAARRFGCLYVLEGSTLGGQVILKTLTARLPHAMAQASSYLRAYGPGVGSMWKRFGAALEQFAGDDVARGDEMVAAAKDTFTAVRGWFAR